MTTSKKIQANASDLVKSIFADPEALQLLRSAFINVISQGGRGTKIYVYLPYRGAISFYIYIVPLGLINIFLHVERDKISCGLQPTRFSLNFL